MENNRQFNKEGFEEKFNKKLNESFPAILTAANKIMQNGLTAEKENTLVIAELFESIVNREPVESMEELERRKEVDKYKAITKILQQNITPSVDSDG